jgi:predicted nicotinamide N-methyase
VRAPAGYTGGVDGALSAVRTSLAEQLAALREAPVEALPAALLDVVVRRIDVPGGEVFLLRPADWAALREQEAEAGRPVPYWAHPWASGLALATDVGAAPPRRRAHVLELGCGLALPSIVAARAGADVLASDGATDAVAFAAHSLALNDVDATVAHADWTQHGDVLARAGPWDVVLAADVLYTAANVDAALRLLPRLLRRGGELRLADPDRAGARDFLAAARATFHLWTRRAGDVRLHTLRRR